MNSLDTILDETVVERVVEYLGSLGEIDNAIPWLEGEDAVHLCENLFQWPVAVLTARESDYIFVGYLDEQIATAAPGYYAANLSLPEIKVRLFVHNPSFAFLLGAIVNEVQEYF